MAHCSESYASGRKCHPYRLKTMGSKHQGTLRSGLLGIVGLALLLAWTAGWLAFSSQLHTGWLAEEVKDPEHHGTIAIHEIITGVMILLGWLFGLGVISQLSSGQGLRRLIPTRPKWKDEVAYCPECNKILRTSLAKQCRHCGADWH